MLDCESQTGFGPRGSRPEVSNSDAVDEYSTTFKVKCYPYYMAHISTLNNNKFRLPMQRTVILYATRRLTVQLGLGRK